MLQHHLEILAKASRMNTALEVIQHLNDGISVVEKFNGTIEGGSLIDFLVEH